MNNSNLKTADDFKCPGCGAPISYDPATGGLHCEYCGYEENINKETSDIENDFVEGQNEDNNWTAETKIIHCDNCGADNVLNAGEMSVTCPFCGSNHTIMTNQVTGIKPHRIIPFQIPSQNVKDAYRKWLRKKIFVPRKVKKQIPNIKLNGVYLPIWTFDSNASSSYDGKLGKYYTRTVGSGKNRRTVTEIRYFCISGNKSLFFDDFIVNAGTKISQQEMNAIAPFYTNNSFVYEKEFMAGFSSEHYSVRLNDGWNIAKGNMDESMKRAILNDYHYDVVAYLNVTTNYTDIKYKYVLIPVWIGVYTYKNKTYRFIANGVTGRFTGKAPVSVLKVLLFVAIILAIVILLFVLTQSADA